MPVWLVVLLTSAGVGLVVILGMVLYFGVPSTHEGRPVSGGGQGPARTLSSPEGASSAPGRSRPPADRPRHESAAAQDQADAVDALLDDMAASRSRLGRGIDEASSCDSLDEAISDFDQVGTDRTRQLDQARSLEVYALDGGRQLKSAMVRSIDASLDADQAFVRWATAELGCSGDTPQDSYYSDGMTISEERATPAKQEFLSRWNAIAGTYGKSRRSPDDV